MTEEERLKRSEQAKKQCRDALGRFAKQSTCDP